MIQRMNARRGLACLVAAFCLSFAALPAAADRYDPQEAGHPLRIAAYFLHPVGVVLDLVLFRPAHWVFGQEPLARLVGHEPYLD